MPQPPGGTVTFLFTDIEGSTRRWERYPDLMRAALAQHDSLLRNVIEASGGYVFKTMGDAFCAAFSSPPDALQAALQAQQALHVEEWPQELGPVRVRMAMHMGVADLQDGDYFGQPLNRVARLLSAGHGGQTLLSLPVYELVRDALPTGITLQDLGEHRLKDLIRPERIFQVVAPGAPAEFPPLKTLDNRPNNLPLQHTPLVGREREVAAVVERLRQPEVRLLTLTGPGGTGKTRLGLQAAAEMLDAFEHGVYFVNLAPISDPGLVVSTIAQALGVQESPSRPLLDSLKEYLREKEMLLLLDNFEQVTEAAPTLNDLLAAASGIKALVTSRVVLRLYGEHDYAVPPLSLPDVKHLPPLERLSQYEAVRLFIERAQAAKADFEVTNENAPAVAEICARLDGLPLAIELAAARIRLLPPQAILARLESRLKLLTGGARDVPARQQTLRNAIEWSYELLDAGEEKLFRRLAVFVGGRTLEAIEAVCNAEDDLEVDVLDGVQSLVDKSLLRQEEGVGGEPRFVMLETIHEYAREKLEESGEGEELRRRHAAYFLTVAEQAEGQLSGPTQAEWAKRLIAEHDNLRAALLWAIGVNPKLALSMASALGYFWESYDYLTEGRELMSRVLSQPGAATPTIARAKTLFRLGRLIHNQGDLPTARAAIEESVAMAREVGDTRVLAGALRSLGAIEMYQGNFGVARALHEESLELYRALGDKVGIRWSLIGLGNLAGDMGDNESARTFNQEALAVGREIGHKRGMAVSLLNLGEIAIEAGDYASARDFIEQGAALYREIGIDPERDPATLMYLARLSTYDGNYRLARTLFDKSLVVARELHSGIDVAVTLVYLASLELLQIRPYRAATLLGAVEGLTKAGETFLAYGYRAEYERNLAAARAQLDETTFQAAWEEGQAMSMEEAIAYALEETEEASHD